MKQETILYLFCTVIIFLLNACGPINIINQYHSKGYTFILNENDTLEFTKIYLDNNYQHSFEINKNSKTISYHTTADSLSELLNFKRMEELYKEDAEKIAFIIYQGDFFGEENKFYIQRSLLENPHRLKDEVLNEFGCNRRRGDILIFE